MDKSTKNTARRGEKLADTMKKAPYRGAVELKINNSGLDLPWYTNYN